MTKHIERIGHGLKFMGLSFGWNPRRWRCGFDAWKGVNLCTLARGKTYSFSGLMVTIPYKNRKGMYDA